MNDFVLFGVLPYVVMVVFFIVTIQRYRLKAFSYSSLSSQFLENQHHFWGSVPFHYGILVVLCGHVIGFLLPGTILSWNAEPLRLMLLEVTGIAFAVLTLVGLANIMIRRRTSALARRVTTSGDWIVYCLLLVQVLTGIGVAVFHGWGSSWFATNLTPWLWSLVKLSPDVTFVAALPLMVKAHVINAFLLIGFFPFTRLVHILVVPNPYLWRRTQVVIWNWDRTKVNNPD
ncbi:MAG: respiratory nitrate reductase subunit gamma [Planctomycetes bacterium]|jgi:nitrate reductase gamma subunit|nr:respiratory nitrate reductase subunit gamma [Planctomycetota bacterium]MDP6410197.1 respiratory nitrate reductase subunit gamma [Planctomycetota bacterium]